LQQKIPRRQKHKNSVFIKREKQQQKEKNFCRVFDLIHTKYNDRKEGENFIAYTTLSISRAFNKRRDKTRKPKKKTTTRIIIEFTKIQFLQNIEEHRMCRLITQEKITIGRRI
jgi:hypothetical protein